MSYSPVEGATLATSVTEPAPLRATGRTGKGFPEPAANPLDVRRSSLLVLTCLMAPVLGHADAPQVVRFYADPHAENNQDPTEIFAQGEAVFDPEVPYGVGLDDQNDPSRRELGLFGMDAKAIAIWRPEAVEPALWFAIGFYDFQQVAPEVTSWRWTFNVDGVPYQLEALRGGLTAASTFEADPPLVDASLPTNNSFRLLGPCSTVNAALRCPFNRVVTGEIDTNADRIIWKVPVDTPFYETSIISAHPAGAATEYMGQVNDQVVQERSYIVRNRRIMVGVRQPNGTVVLTPSAAFVADVDAAGRIPFFLNLNVSLLDRGALGPETPYEVYAVACSGQTCPPAPSSCGPQATDCVTVNL